MEYSKHQTAIFNWITGGRGSAIVEAVAGSGKTTTIVAAANLLSANLSCAFVAFNKSIAEELKSRLPKHVKAMTLNSMGFQTWARFIGQQYRVEVDGNKVRNIIQEVVPGDDREEVGNGLAKLVALAKSIGIAPGFRGALTRDTDENWLNLIDHYDVDVQDMNLAIKYARIVLAKDIETGKQVIDFDDQLYLPVIHGARFWQNDWLFVDEAQDVNQIQRAMLRRALKPNGRLVAVGDPHQAIYGFRGADTDAIINIKKEFGAVTFPLSVSYRCPKAIVKEAHNYVSHIESTLTAPEGKVESLDKYEPATFEPTDAILCRNTGPLVQQAYKLLRAKVACRVLGREIGVGLTAMVKKMKAKTIESLVQRLAAYVDRECAAFIAKGQEEKADALTDRVQTIHVFIDQLGENRRTVPALVEEIESLFTDNNKGVLTLATCHKSKGLEFPRVFILNRELMPSPWARQPWQMEQERNLQYVATTRAKSELYFIQLKGFRA